jgi:hypothetical protein
MVFSVASDLNTQSGSIDPRRQWPRENKIAVANFASPEKNASKKPADRDESLHRCRAAYRCRSPAVHVSLAVFPENDVRASRPTLEFQIVSIAIIIVVPYHVPREKADASTGQPISDQDGSAGSLPAHAVGADRLELLVGYCAGTRTPQTREET